MEIKNIIDKMRITEDLLRNLKNVGFYGIKPLLFAINISKDTVLYRDYRNEMPRSYAYYKGKPIHSDFEERKIMEKIESRLLGSEDALEVSA